MLRSNTKRKARPHVKVKYESGSDGEIHDAKEKKVLQRKKRVKKLITANVSVEQIRRVHSKLEDEYGTVPEPKAQARYDNNDPLIKFNFQIIT